MHQSFFKKSEEFYSQYGQDPVSNLGIITSNGTLSNITALWVARNRSFSQEEQFQGIAQEGFISALNYYDYREIIVLASPLVHYSFEKAEFTGTR